MRPVIRLAVIGAGHMGSAMIRGVLASKRLVPQHVMAADSAPARLAALRGAGIRTTRNNRAAVAWANLVILAVKPTEMAPVIREIRPVLSRRHLVISIAAGVRLAWLRREVGPGPRLIRALPNLPAIVGAGMTALAPAPGTPRPLVVAGVRLFEAVGRVIVVRERWLDAITGVSGSGPAFVCLVIGALADGGIKAGLPGAVARMLAAQTAYGAGRLLLDQGARPEKVVRAVASPGGTTVAGLRVLDQGRVRASLIQAVMAAARRATQLGARR